MDPTKQEMLDAIATLRETLGDECDIIDVEAAIYWFSSDYHGGQTSNLYSVLSTSEYDPSPLSKGIESEPEVAQMIYSELESTFAPK